MDVREYPNRKDTKKTSKSINQKFELPPQPLSLYLSLSLYFLATSIWKVFSSSIRLPSSLMVEYFPTLAKKASLATSCLPSSSILSLTRIVPIFSWNCDDTRKRRRC